MFRTDSHFGDCRCHICLNFMQTVAILFFYVDETYNDPGLSISMCHKPFIDDTTFVVFGNVYYIATTKGDIVDSDVWKDFEEEDVIQCPS